jgi:hypothetical protein
MMVAKLAVREDTCTKSAHVGKDTIDSVCPRMQNIYSLHFNKTRPRFSRFIFNEKLIYMCMYV